MFRVLIVGGGITGLSTAYYLQEWARKGNLPLNLSLIESGSAWGGKITTEHQDGFLIEGGPDSFFTPKPWATQLCYELGLAERLLPARERHFFVLRQGRLIPFPPGLLLLVPTKITPMLRSRLLSWGGKLRMSLEPFIPPRRDGGDESLAQFVRRRLGQEVLDFLAEPLLGSIYSMDVERMSLFSTVPRFRDLERQYGSLFRAAAAYRSRTADEAAGQDTPIFLTLRDGLGELVEALVHHLAEHSLFLGHKAVRVTLRSRSLPGYRVDLGAGNALEGEAVVVTTPAYAAADLVAELDRSLAALLRAIPYISSIAVSLGYRAADLSHSLDGSGFVVPRREKRRIRACSWSSAKFEGRAPAGHVLVRAFIEGKEAEHLLAKGDDAGVIRTVSEELRDLMGIAASPVIVRIHRWVRAHPQYEVGHPDRAREIEGKLAAYPGLFLAGSAYHGIGLPDCIRDAKAAAERVASWIQQLLSG